MLGALRSHIVGSQNRALTQLLPIAASTILPTSISSAMPYSTETPSASSSHPHIDTLVVFGGSGFVGTRVCQQAVQTLGIKNVISVSRKGKPAHLQNDTSPWVQAVSWKQGDALDPQQGWKDLLSPATSSGGGVGVVSTLGAFGSNEFMYKVCGTANMVLMDAAKKQGVSRFSFISVHDYKFPAGWNTQNFLLKGYFQGKRDAEAHLAQVFPETGVAIRPGFVYGSRNTGSVTVPLSLIGAPLAVVMKMLPTRSLSNIPILGGAFVPPVSVDLVGRAAATAATSYNVAPGIMDVWTISSSRYS